MRSNRLDMLAVSDFCVDLLLHGNVHPRFGQVEQRIGGYTLALGGSANIFAAQVAGLGGRAGLIGVAGRDLFGQFALEALRACEVDTTRIRSSAEVRTGLGVGLCEPDDRAILTFPGSLDAVTPEQLHAVRPDDAAHWHIASYFLLNRLRSSWPAWCRRLAEEGVTRSLDTNWDPDGRWEGVVELLPWIDVFLPNAAEARAISGEHDLERAGRALAKHGPLVVIKDGANGALAVRPGGAAVQLALSKTPLEPGRIVDTVGAGDCFDAGFLRGWQLGHELLDCLALGLECAEASLQAAGGVAGRLRRQVAERSVAVTPEGEELR